MTHNVNANEMAAYFSGERLYGNDFTQEEIAAWFVDEADGYFDLVKSGGAKYTYDYHQLNKRHGFSALPSRRYPHVLGVGSAYGHELEPILGSSDKISILEPSDGFIGSALGNVPLNYVRPVANGDLPFATATLDLITCFGVLHHIPNVEKVLREFHRSLTPGGFALVREPIISMGDWRKPRAGLTKRERGIPLALLHDMILGAGFEIVRERKCMFALTSRLKYVLPGPVFNNKTAVAIDAFLCSLPVWSTSYHANGPFQKLRATAVFCVLQKPVASLFNQ